LLHKGENQKKERSCLKMKKKIVLIMNMCTWHMVGASSVSQGIDTSFLGMDTPRTFSQSIVEACKEYPYLVGGAALLGTAFVVGKVVQSRKRSRSESSSSSSSPEFDMSEYIARAEEGVIQFLQARERDWSALEGDTSKLEEIATRMEKIRIVRQVLKLRERLRTGKYQASLVKHKENSTVHVWLKGSDGKGYHYRLHVLDGTEGSELCRGLNSYLASDSVTQTAGEQKLRTLMDLPDEEPFEDGALKSLLNAVRSTCPPWEG
jgi:hypothetical protein